MKRRIIFTVLWWLTMVAFVWSGTEHFTTPVIALKTKVDLAGEFGTIGWLRAAPSLLWGVLIMLRDLFVAVAGLFLATYVLWGLFVPKGFSPFELLPRRSPSATVMKPLITIADVMMAAYERRYVRCLWTLLAALFAILLLWRLQPTVLFTVTALLIAALYLLVTARQALMQWRVAKSHFCDNEHEVRQLLSFVLLYGRDDDFTTGGHPKPALYDAKESDVSAAVAPVTS